MHVDGAKDRHAQLMRMVMRMIGMREEGENQKWTLRTGASISFGAVVASC